MKRIAYSGIEGCFAHIAARKLFPDEMYVAFGSFRQAYDAVAGGGYDMAVLPIENSYAGKVTEVAKMLEEGKLKVIDTYSLPVTQNLLGIRGSRLGDIKTVISHPKALEQCDNYIKDRGYEVIRSTNTAVAAKEIINRRNMSVAAIASLETAAMYGLKVLEEGINETDDNITTFAVVALDV
ncbi:MAG: hypothetical protein K6E49_08010 [Lachnospiraceae bacterium]|nr:hypothetical protein [Lachnospiraceae bacterium]